MTLSMYTLFFGAETRAALPPGEHLLATAMFTVLMGDESRLDPALHPDRMARLVGGRVGAGPATSAAGRLWRVQRAARKESLFCAVTDRRLLLLESARVRVPVPTDPDPASIVAEVPRESVVAAHWRPRPPQAGRIVLRFADGSTFSPVVSLLWPGAALRLVHALH